MKALIPALTRTGRFGNSYSLLNHLSVVVAMCCFTASMAHSALVLTLNTVDKTFALTGTDTDGLHVILPDGGWNIWTVDVPGGTGITSGDFVRYDNDLAFTTDAGSPGSGHGWDIQITVYDTSVELKIGTNSTIEQTITGTGAFQSYNKNSNFVTHVEQAIGDTLDDPDDPDTTPEYLVWNSITVTSVPEPAASAVLLGLVALTCTAIAKYRRVSR